MKSNKILAIKNLVFNLPDDFNGNLTEALELYIEYRKTKVAKEKRTLDDDKVRECENIYDAVEYLYSEPNYKAHMEANMIEWKDNEWKSMIEEDIKMD